MPEKSNPYDSGWDLVALEVIPKNENVFFIDTGIQIEPPLGYYTEVYPRSSIYKTDFIQANSAGIIDSGYRGNIMVPLRYVSSKDGLSAARALIGQRFAQLIIREYIDVKLVLADSLKDSVRGTGGFGSSGER